ncbi:unnamed protein product [Phaedon cochleariae]|uniref:AAA+ ATPase domain-containing protein n=1 Tax=Phaedon cochleariae TaxID=80249 RepID=A0A9N9SAD1_PHACE|nr:unnamed protein product [Phaedon cochleariae]
MEGGYTVKLENPRKKANFLSVLIFGWMTSLVSKAVTKGLDIIDLYKVLDEDRSKTLGDRLQEKWEKELARSTKKNVKPSLLRAISNTFLPEYMWWGVLFFLQYAVIKSLQPVVLSYTIDLFTDPGNANKTKEMYISITVLIILTTMVVFLMHHTFFGTSRIGMKVRIAVSTLIYRKIMKLNHKSLGETTAGHVVNLLSNDVSRFDLVLIFLHALWVMPFQIIIMSYVLWNQVQISALAGIVSMAVFSIPVQGYLGKLTGVLRYRIAGKTDKRVKLMNEVISGIQVIKMYAWEKSFEKMVKSARATEIVDLTSTSYLRGLFSSCMVFIERLCLFLTVICYTLLGNIISAAKVFSVAQSLNTLQFSMAILYPQAISTGAEALMSIKRLEEFLVMEEKETIIPFEELKAPGVVLSNVCASWTGISRTLSDISLQIPPGTLCAVIGQVGSGKSSLLQLLLGELPIESGKVSIGGQMSYSSQKPWLFQSTVRNNILFGEPYVRAWYNKVVKVCALEKDFDQFPQRDQTIVGERGVSLSGGQRARINLARTIYREADIYLLDDPLSAVDTHVGRHLFDECIHKQLKGKTRILVTHQLQYLKKANLIVVFNEGRIEAQGTFAELSKSDLDFTKLLVSADQSKANPEDSDKELSGSLTPRLRQGSVYSKPSSTFSDGIDILESSPVVDEETISDPNAKPLKNYVAAPGNVCLNICLGLNLLLAQAACTGSDYWSAFWTEQEELRYSNYSSLVVESIKPLETIEVYSMDNRSVPEYQYTYTREIDLSNPDQRSISSTYNDMFDTIDVGDASYTLIKTNASMIIYGVLIILAVILTLSRSILYYKMCMLASKNLHSKMFNALLKAPMRFFDTNPSGRVLNRFSKDMGAIDELLPRVLLDAIQIGLVAFGILINIAVANNYLVIPMVIVGVLFWKIRTWYALTARAVKRLEGTTKSPVFSHLSATLNGITTIRAFKAEEALRDEFDEHQDVHTSSWYLTISSTYSFGLWIDMICLVFLICVSFSFVILHTFSTVSGSLVGLAISQCLILCGMLQHGIRQTAEVVNQLTSVERVLQYTTIEVEGPFETPIEKVQALASWPEAGRLCFKNVFMKYVADDPPVLKNLNFEVKPGEKVGIVGRTGAGKSSLISALFRLSPLDGKILIDGVDSKEIGLTELRKKISIIPQEPVLFSATMRYNLDPFEEFEDQQLWNALEQVELKEAVSSLDFIVTEGGNNFSLGQRQLICLARAILRDNKIMVLDEATANVDQRTDAFIQETIRNNFKHCTVLTIAHRLNTIMDSDKVLVMHFGSMVEFDHPHKLLQLPDGHFHQMVLETGPVMSLQLKDIAQDVYNSTHEGI